MSESREPDLSTVSSPPRRSDIKYADVKGGETIDSGGQAIVKRVSLHGPDPPDTIAVKEPHSSPETLPRDSAKAFFDEAHTWQKLDTRERTNQYRDTDHIVGIVAIGERQPWVAMEYMDGGSLADRLEATSGGLPLEEALWIGECLCKGVKIAHDNGIAHLDLKPANVLFRETPSDSWDVPKIADWGLARTLIEDSGRMEAFSIYYAAPEQIDAGKFGKPDAYTDIYQIGAIMYELLTGRPPYTGGRASVKHNIVSESDPAPPSTRREVVPTAVDEIVLEALNTDKPQRYRGSIDRLEESIRENRQLDSTATCSEPTDWPMFGFECSRTGVPDGRFGPDGPVTPCWQFDTKFLGKFTSPAVVDDTVYVGMKSGRLFALNKGNGEQRWRFDFNSKIACPPVVADGIIYIGSTDGCLYAIDAETGQKQWGFQAGGFSPTAAVVDGTVFVGSDDLYALDPDDGKKRWQCDSGGRQFVATTDKVYSSDLRGLYAIDAATGREHWRSDITGSSRPPAVLNDTLYIGDNTGADSFESASGLLSAVKVENGNLRWQISTDGHIVGGPTLREDTVYIGSNGKIYALHAKTSDQRWQFGVDEKIQSSPIVVDNTVYFGSTSKLYAIDMRTGKKRWDWKLWSSKHWDMKPDDEVTSSPAIVDETIYLGSQNGLYALSVSD